ncbi:hypothetical protein IAQ61_000588 [Plenodomus lingam]|uniref:uncharacterized protein n=1 Tax=Leptosphaeria maculans TaxID=5022 RepID=UPI00332808FE|nr:hypothetical protein IAQ61_000588 [Plenodomus lingam]
MTTVTLILHFLLFRTACALNFDWERTQLTDSEAALNSAIRFGSLASSVVTDREECRAVPGDASWPSDAAWASLNDTLDGALLKPRPLASVCYYGVEYNATKCEQLRSSWKSMNLHTEDPTSVMSQWASGSSCTPTLYPNSTCTQGGFPIYVVRATTIKHIQIAVNFARNHNIRLVIKNTGHDFNGKSIGGYSLGVWTHNLKDMVYHANYTSPTGSYTGRAVAYSAGVQAYEGTALMRKNNMTFIVAGGATVGIAGGFLQGGGHSSYTSYYGLAADQVLALTAVTADGRVVECHEGLNEDLFWAFRGGGGGTFGILTSVVVRAFSLTPIISSSIRFSTTPNPGSNTSLSAETFWAGMEAYWKFSPQICAAGGLGYNFIYPTNTPTGLTFTVGISVPNMSAIAYGRFLHPLIQELNDLGIEVPLPALKRSLHTVDTDDNISLSHSHSHLASRGILHELTPHTLLSSRLFPRSSFSPSTLPQTHTAIRTLVASNLTFHGMSYCPLSSLSPFTANAVNPAFRTTLLHAQAYFPTAHWDGAAPLLSRAELTAQHGVLQAAVQQWRDVSPGGGSYVNEGDAQDWEWQQGFYGANYPELREVKASCHHVGQQRHEKKRAVGNKQEENQFHGFGFGFR